MASHKKVWLRQILQSAISSKARYRTSSKKLFIKKRHLIFEYCLFSADRLTYSFGKEVERMKFNLKSKSAWRITYINEDFT